MLGFLFLPGGTGAPLRVHPDPGRGLQSLWQRGPLSRCGGRISALGIRGTLVRASRVLGRAPRGEAGCPGSCRVAHAVSGTAFASGSCSQVASPQATVERQRPAAAARAGFPQISTELQPGTAPRSFVDFMSPLFCRLHLILGWPDI